MFYLFTYTSASDKYDSHMDDVLNIIANVKFK